MTGGAGEGPDLGTGHGLSARQVREIARTLAPWADRIDAVILFGSRAQGTWHPGSDVDLGLRGRLEPRDMARIRGAFEASSLPLFVDVVDLDAASSAALLEHVARVGKPLLDGPHLVALACGRAPGPDVPTDGAPGGSGQARP